MHIVPAFENYQSTRVTIFAVKWSSKYKNRFNNHALFKSQTNTTPDQIARLEHYGRLARPFTQKNEEQGEMDEINSAGVRFKQSLQKHNIISLPKTCPVRLNELSTQKNGRRAGSKRCEITWQARFPHIFFYTCTCQIPGYFNDLFFFLGRRKIWIKRAQLYWKPTLREVVSGMGGGTSC